MQVKFTKSKAFLPKTLFLAVAFLLVSGQLFAQVTTEVEFTTTGSEQTWTVPGGVNEVTIECWGAGGGGGYMNSINNAGAGGGGGAYSKTTIAVEPCKTITLRVGKGGEGRSSSNSETDATGGDSYAKYGGSTVTLAKGGTGGAQNNYSTVGIGGKAAEGIGDVKYSGGNGGTGSTGLYAGSGGGGAAAGRTGNGGNGGNGAQGDVVLVILIQAHPGDAGQIAAGSTYSGNGAQGVYVSLISSVWTDVAGKNGENYGGGGSGMAAGTGGSVSGGNGAQGYVRITYTTPEPMSVDNMTTETCSGKPFSVTPTGTNIYPNTTYSWPAPVASDITGLAPGNNQTTVNGTLTNSTIDDKVVTYNVSAMACDVVAANFTVAVTVKGILQPGTIGVNILSCSEGDTSKSFVNVTDGTAAGHQYLWAMSTDNLNWSIIEGASNKNYTPVYNGHPGVTYYKRGYYSDCDTVYSNTVTLTYPGTVFPGNVVSTQPQKYCKDSTVTALLSTDGITVQSGTSYSIQWQKSNDNGTTWNNIPDSVNNTFHVNIPQLTAKVSYRYTITLAGCSDSIISNNQWDYTLHTNPVAKLTVSDTCPENTAFYISADITPGDAPVTLYKWNNSTTYGPYSADTIHKGSFTPACGELYQSTLMVKDTNGCVSDTAKLTFHTPTKPTISILSVPAEITSSSSICKSVIPDLKDTISAAFHSDCEFLIPATYTQDSVPGAEIALGTTVPVTAIYKTVCNTSKNDTLVINVVAPTSLPLLTPADIVFDDSNDTINLYYGVCDTLYYVNKPTYSIASGSPFNMSELTLSNDKSSANEGPILGYITGGEYTIVWSLSSACGDTIKYTKKYIVMYPPCGGSMTVTDADGIVYQTVRVGCECWTKPNLKTITGVTGNSYVYQNKDANIEKYGRLYSWYSAVGLPENSTNTPDTTTDPISHVKYIKGVCPTGWAIPTTASFESMYHAAGDDVKNIKSTNISTWLSGLTGTDATGFGAVGAGYYTDASPYYFDLLGEAFFWTSEGTAVEKKGTCCSITLKCPKLLYYTTDAGMGYSIRCVRRINE